MKTILTTIVAVIVLAMSCVIYYDSTTENVSTITFDKQLKYIDTTTNCVSYYAIIGTNGETFRVEVEDIPQWKDKRLYKGCNYEITTYGYFNPKIYKVKRLKKQK